MQLLKLSLCVERELSFEFVWPFCRQKWSWDRQLPCTNVFLVSPFTERTRAKLHFKAKTELHQWLDSHIASDSRMLPSIAEEDTMSDSFTVGIGVGALSLAVLIEAITIAVLCRYRRLRYLLYSLPYLSRITSLSTHIKDWFSKLCTKRSFWVALWHICIFLKY